MHDAGCNRSQTVAALPKLIAGLRAHGFRFTTVSQLAGIPAGQAQLPTTAAQRLRGRAFDTMLALADGRRSWVEGSFLSAVRADDDLAVLIASSPFFSPLVG